MATTRYAEFAHVFTAIVEGKPLERSHVSTGEWMQLSDIGIDNLLFEIAQGSVSSSCVRVARPHVMIGNVRVPEPERTAPEPGTPYFIPKLSSSVVADKFVWQGGDFDLRVLSSGLVHLTSENAAAHAEALVSFTAAAPAAVQQAAPAEGDDMSKMRLRVAQWLQAAKAIDAPATMNLLDVCVASKKLRGATDDEVKRLAAVQRFVFAVHGPLQL